MRALHGAWEHKAAHRGRRQLEEEGDLDPRDDGGDGGRRSRRLLNFEVLADGVVPGFVMLVGVLGVEKACCGEGLVENECKLGGGRVSTF